jgi:quercetin dioxygenase-like cupin family protein
MNSVPNLEPEIVRFEDAPGYDDLFIDNFIGYRRTNFMLVGPNVGWEEHGRKPPIAATDFIVGMQRLSPNGETALHTHNTNEVFVPLNAPLIFYWGDGGKDEVELGRWDVISFPAGVWRGIRNDGTEDAYVLAAVGGPDGGRAQFHPRILEEAKARGYVLDERGYRVGEWQARAR